MNSQMTLLNESLEPKNDRPLIAYALLAQTTQVHGDLLSGLAPIFKPIAKKWVGRKFDAKQLANEVRDLYGIDIHPWAVDDLAPRLEKAGLITRNRTSDVSEEYVYASVTDEFNSVSESDIRSVVDSFCRFAKPILNQNDLIVDDKALSDAFLDQLVSMDFHAILLKPVKSSTQNSATGRTLSLPKKKDDEKIEAELSTRAKLDVLCASFIVDAYETNRQLYDLISKIAAGALIAEVVLNLQDPGSKPSLALMNVVLDAPFVMSLLDLSSEESHIYARQIHESLKSNKANVIIFRHSVDEIRSNLQGVINHVSNGEGYGPTARRLNQSIFKQYVMSVLRDVESAVKAIASRIDDSPSDTAKYNFFSKEAEDAFFGWLGTYGNPAAQRRDAASIAGVMRLRAGRAVRMSMFHTAAYIFVTENPRLAECAARYVTSRKLQRDDDVPPAITDRYLAGMLWVLYGGKAEDLTRYRLLANCTAALEPRSEVVKKVHKFLSELDEVKADRFRALMTDERAGQHLMQFTLGDSLLVKSTEDAEQIFNRLEESLRSRIEKTYADKAERQAAAHAEEREIYRLAKENLEEELAERNRQNAHVNAELEKLREEGESVSGQLQALQQARCEEKRLAVQRCAQTAGAAVSRRKRIISYCVGGAFFVASFVGAELGTSYGHIVAALISAFSAFVAWAGFWFIPDLLFEHKLVQLREDVFERELGKFGLFLEKDNYVVDWATETVRTELKTPLN
ncbi:hypothetical protein [Burkholderia stagnalis]|uniref:hypothetical protein n=1 Tax=Burkholderia stagnalis TaxID=1503054 RepID=UPI000A52B17E|nr:hypothetical protein [Burkholderia stagnalis]